VKAEVRSGTKVGTSLRSGGGDGVGGKARETLTDVEGGMWMMRE
jgi:hypothetical protein